MITTALTGDFEKMPLGYPCMTRIYGYVYDNLKKHWVYDDEWYHNLVLHQLKK